MRDGYNPNFVSDMGQHLGPHYAALFPQCKAIVMQQVDAYADRVIERMTHGDAAFTAQLVQENFVEPFQSYLQRSGKYVRPYIVSMVLEAYGSPQSPHERVIAAAEIIHSASLILDDIADDSVLRRGAPTAHVVHGSRLAGACASAWLNAPLDIVAEHAEDYPDAIRAALIEAMAWEHFATGLGTTLDVTWAAEQSFSHSPDEYLQQILYRAASYSYRLPFKLGAIAADVPLRERETLAAFGEGVGLAFQLVDDILNVRPGDGHWGKEVGEDIAQGKITLQVLIALSRASTPQRERLLSVLGSATHDERAIADAIDVLDETGALEACRQRAHRLLDGTVDSIRTLSISERYQSILEDLAFYVIRRQR
jgi:geranylgeranyl pyrophosphate synthase